MEAITGREGLEGVNILGCSWRNNNHRGSQSERRLVAPSPIHLLHGSQVAIKLKKSFLLIHVLCCWYPERLKQAKPLNFSVFD